MPTVGAIIDQSSCNNVHRICYAVSFPMMPNFLHLCQNWRHYDGLNIENVKILPKCMNFLDFDLKLKQKEGSNWKSKTWIVKAIKLCFEWNHFHDFLIIPVGSRRSQSKKVRCQKTVFVCVCVRAFESICTDIDIHKSIHTCRQVDTYRDKYTDRQPYK